MASCNRSCFVVLLVVCLITPLYASPLFFGIFGKNNNRNDTSSTGNTNRDFAIDFSVSTDEETSQPSFFERVASTARLVSAFIKSFVTVLTNRNSAGENRSIDELAAEDPFKDYDPFGVEPSEAGIDFFSDIDNPPTNAASRGRSLDSKPDDTNAASGDQNLESKASDANSTTDVGSEGAKVSSDIVKAVLLGSARLETIEADTSVNKRRTA